jgi:hypothetical protein
MNNLEIGIPAYKNLHAALEKADELRSGGFSGRIHISVNDPNSEDYSLAKGSTDPLLLVSLQEGNLGLYGNFRFLAKASEAKFFMWLALDDEPDWVAIGAIQSGQTGFILCYSRHFLKIAAREGSAAIIYGPIDPLKPSNVFNFDPSAIFGAWDSTWLTANFPDSDFDWLDSYILTAAHLSGATRLLPGQRSIGADLGKRPHNVSGPHHRIWGWFSHCARLILKSKRFDLVPAFIISTLGRSHMIWKQRTLTSGTEKSK